MRKELPTGSIEYHMPDIAEGMTLLGLMGVGEQEVERLSENGANADMIFLGRLIKHMGIIIDRIEGAASYRDIIKDFSNMAPLMEVGQEVMEQLSAFEGKKKAPSKS